MATAAIDGTPAFLALDLPDAPRALGVARLAKKVLRDGAELLARSVTYGFAALGEQAGGASIGVDATPEDRDGALEALCTALADEVAAGRLLVDPAKGVTESDLAALRAVDPRPSALWGLQGGHRVADLVLADGVVAAAHVALGGLDGATVAVEVTSPSAVAVVDRLLEVGAQVVALAGPKGAVACPTDAAGAIRAALDGGAGVGLADAIEGSTPLDELHAAEADVLVVGSRAGVLAHEAAEHVAARAIVPHGPVPVTARAFAVLRRREIAVLPDFVTTAGTLVAALAEPDLDAAALRAAAVARVGEVMTSVQGHADGPLLGACERAEEFLGTWQDELPFGRPLA